MKIEFVPHKYGEKTIWYALNSADSDVYVTTLREGHPIPQAAVDYAGRIFQREGRQLRIADVGANLGTVALPAAICFGAQVLAIEALPANVALLAAAVMKNGLNGSVVPVHMAAYKTVGLVDVAGFSAWGVVGERIARGIPVPAAPIVDIIKLHGFVPDLVKIDIEGAELAGLTGIERLCTKNPRVEFIFEINSLTCGEWGYFGQDLCKKFEQMGFTLFAWRPDGSLAPLPPAQPHRDVCFDALATKRGTEYLVEGLGCKISPYEAEETLVAYEGMSQGEHYMKNHVLRNQAFFAESVRATGRFQKLLEHARSAPGTAL
jgi:FkbM family methyltransferase